MAKYKVGQKVVFDGYIHPSNYLFNDPKQGEIVTIKALDYSMMPILMGYDIVGYEYSKNGLPQCFDEIHLHPLIEDESNDHASTFISNPISRRLQNISEIVRFVSLIRWNRENTPNRSNMEKNLKFVITGQRKDLDVFIVIAHEIVNDKLSTDVKITFQSSSEKDAEDMAERVVRSINNGLLSRLEDS